MNDYGIATVRECRILINRSVFYCGMHSHISTVANGEVQYYKEVTRDECERMHATGSYTYQDLVINDIPRNGSITTPHTFAGTSGEFSKCTAESRYVDAYGTFHDVVVQGFIKIDMQSYTAKVDMEADKLQLVSGASCTASSRHCVSPDGSEAYWSTVEMGECGINKYSIIYDGYITKIEDLEEENVVYMLSTQDRNFALKMRQCYNNTREAHYHSKREAHHHSKREAHHHSKRESHHHSKREAHHHSKRESHHQRKRESHQQNKRDFHHHYQRGYTQELAHPNDDDTPRARSFLEGGRGSL
ncbi:unnamed protein product [Trichogramma brassicae]|uniref:Uncharacterized protein n=1 Tax=Trichogramma brassicae TaxID=86971 RepID=A0A6H5IYW7_9HYME|nr:unnamed protein product [Trichogramma brassicae]